MKFSLLSIKGKLCFPGKCNLLSSLRKRRNTRKMALDGCKDQIKEESINVSANTGMREIPATPGCFYLGLQMGRGMYRGLHCYKEVKGM